MEGTRISQKAIKVVGCIEFALVIAFCVLLIGHGFWTGFARTEFYENLVAGILGVFFVGTALLVVLSLAGEHIDAVADYLVTDEIVRRRVKGTVVGRAISPEIEVFFGFGSSHAAFKTTVAIGKSWEYTFDDTDTYCEFLTVGEEVVVVLDEYRDKHGRPFLRKPLRLEHKKAPS